MTRLATPIFDNAHPKILKSLFNLLGFLTACKKSVNSMCSFRLTTNIFDHVQPKIFDQLLIFVNLYQHAKNEAILSICSGEIVDLKIL